ncbi:hypothetical protein HMPREF2649_06475 [Staphylococcus sp. HMSC063F03]|uniref:hypothetical protein n=1 Tax=Staphylococcus TaxID=1279 RepID=UPI0008A83ABD|nr:MULTISPECIES: hypothetical protein [Staphylococcus]MDO0960020.1 hypothetical protein [Staphylococcus haemolyticus]MDO0972329.1 hypothetical protein [Staphylococcus haemolyticus]OHP95724.1 hypothetical protein HMPREF2576_04215 [Staphylococcus sp. HMSC063F05]OHP96405.1 hypothetical protein HMPREF2649_06475 [Staphylococcus sp. HMSC063F03]
MFYPIKNDKYVDVKEVKEVKYSYPHSGRVTNIDIDNIHDLKISDGANYVFVGKSTVVVKGSDILFLQFM